MTSEVTTAELTTSPATVSPADRFLPLLVLLFVGSGCAALIYEIVWFQLLSLIVGSSAISLGVLLATFMGGMCIGSIALSRVVSASQHPLRVYALLELGIGAFGLLVLWLLPWVGGLYTSFGGPGMSGIVVRAIFSALFLLPPTIMMGATLPAIARWVEATPKGVSWLGLFYGGNTFGAVVGCLLAGFYLLRLYDVAIATYAAVGLNVVVAVTGLALARYTPYTRTDTSAATEPVRMAPGASLVLFSIAISGATALGAEVVWVRLMALNFGGTTYTFSLILASFLFGIGLGSGVGSVMARSVRDPRRALGWAQLLVVAGIAWAGYVLLRALPNWPVNPSIATPWFNFQFDFFRAVLTALPAAALWGASFPLALAAVAVKGQDSGQLVGRVYAANTVGAIFGALLASLVMIAWVGTQATQRVMIAFAALSALLMLALVVDPERGRVRLAPRGLVRGAVVLVTAFVLGRSIPTVPPLLVGYGRYAPTYLNADYLNFLYVGEGMNSSMAVSELDNGDRNYHNAGKVQASSEPQDMRLQRMLGHLTTLVPTDAKSVMVIGCGAGVTAGAVSIDPGVVDLTIVEIEPLVPEVVSREFGMHNFNVVDNPKTTVVIDDARHYLLTTDKMFDAITSDPFDPWVKGAATLYTVEFWREAREHLNPGGVVTVFVQLYESNLEAVKSEVATFLEVFPQGMVFANLAYGQGYDVVMLAQNSPTPIDLDLIDAKLNSAEYFQVRESLAEVGFSSAAQLMATFAAKKPEVDPWIADAQINRDRNLRLQYLAGLGVNLYQADMIYRDMARYRTYPTGLFTGSPERLAQLQSSWQSSGE
ncbi:MAG: SAM-dependent methyltransferase [Gemmatimonadetes bacterium]|nr:SAM-dependent methyltransferase [Gemmatimonadota bacterium]